MKALVVYYSRSGLTKKLGEAIAAALGAEIEEIHDTVNRKGILGWLRSGMEGSRGALTTIQPLKTDPADYDLVIIGTPIWAGRMSSATRTYLTQNKGKISKTAFFSVNDSGKTERLFAEMQTLANKPPLALVSVMSGDARSGSFQQAVGAFVEKLKN